MQSFSVGLTILMVLRTACCNVKHVKSQRLKLKKKLATLISSFDKDDDLLEINPKLSCHSIWQHCHSQSSYKSVKLNKEFVTYVHSFIY